MGYITVGSIDDYYKKALEATKEQQTADVNRVNTMSEQQKKSVNDIYNAKIDETDSAYEDDYRENAVQKLINEREVAENMANLGLTDSGLNRTQQTAVQLSYANTKGKIDRQKQAAVDALAQSLAVELANIETTRLSSVADIERQYSQNAMTNATNARNTDIDYNAKLYEAEQKAITEQAKIDAELEKTRIEAEQKIIEEQKEEAYILKTNGGLLSRDFTGSLKDNGVNVRYNSDGTTTYTDNNSGKSSTFDSSINPYTGDNNEYGSSDTAKAWGKYGCFDNGYQPKGIIHNGKDYGYVSSSGIRDMINGNMQNVHKTSDGTLWIWDGKQNKYLVYEE